MTVIRIAVSYRVTEELGMHGSSLT